MQWLSCLLIAVADVKAKQMMDILMGMDDLSKDIKKITKEGKYTKLLLSYYQNMYVHFRISRTARYDTSNQNAHDFLIFSRLTV